MSRSAVRGPWDNTYRDLRSGGARADHNSARADHNWARRITLSPIAGSALQGTQLPIVNSDIDRRHGARNFCDESTVSPMKLLLRHNQDRKKLLSPTGTFPCASFRVLFGIPGHFKVTCTAPPHVGFPWVVRVYFPYAGVVALRSVRRCKAHKAARAR